MLRAWVMRYIFREPARASAATGPPMEWATQEHWEGAVTLSQLSALRSSVRKR